MAQRCAAMLSARCCLYAIGCSVVVVNLVVVAAFTAIVLLPCWESAGQALALQPAIVEKVNNSLYNPT